MPDWRSFETGKALLDHMRETTRAIRERKLDIGRGTYALPLAVGVMQAIHCGHEQLAAVEMGVAQGAGLIDLATAAGYFAETFGLDIKVYGFDRAAGLPPPVDYRDHPEIWHGTQFTMGDPASLREKLPRHAELIIGDIAATVAAFEAELGARKLAFVSIDVDFYSSTMDCLEILKFDRDCYMPAVPMYFDDMDNCLTYNPWCGEPAAINDFNAANRLRKIDRRDKDFRIPRFHVGHILDHPLRTGERATRPHFGLTVLPI